MGRFSTCCRPRLGWNGCMMACVCLCFSPSRPLALSASSVPNPVWTRSGPPASPPSSAQPFAWSSWLRQSARILLPTILAAPTCTCSSRDCHVDARSFIHSVLRLSHAHTDIVISNPPSGIGHSGQPSTGPLKQGQSEYHPIQLTSRCHPSRAQYDAIVRTPYTRSPERATCPLHIVGHTIAEHPHRLVAPRNANL